LILCVWLSRQYKFLSVAVKPRKWPQLVCMMSSFADRFPGIFVTTGQLNIRRFLVVGQHPVYTWYGVVSIAACGSPVFRSIACFNANDQYSDPKPAE